MHIKLNLQLSVIFSFMFFFFCMRFVFISEFLGHNSRFSFLAPKTYFGFITQVYKFGSEVPAVSWEFSWGIHIVPLYFSNVICIGNIYAVKQKGAESE